MINKIFKFMGRAIGRETNEYGGIDPPTEFDLDRSREANLTTLPATIKGTNCSNCLWIHDEGDNNHVCSNPHLTGVPVNSRMCCIHWRNPNEIRPWED